MPNVHRRDQKSPGAGSRGLASSSANILANGSTAVPAGRAIREEDLLLEVSGINRAVLLLNGKGHGYPQAASQAGLTCPARAQARREELMVKTFREHTPAARDSPGEPMSYPGCRACAKAALLSAPFPVCLILRLERGGPARPCQEEPLVPGSAAGASRSWELGLLWASENNTRMPAAARWSHRAQPAPCRATPVR